MLTQMTPATYPLDDGPAVYPHGSGGGGGAPEHIRVEVQVPSTHWDVQHNLGFKPAGIRIEDYAGTDYEGGDVTHIDDNHLTIDIAYPISGYVYLS